LRLLQPSDFSIYTMLPAYRFRGNNNNNDSRGKNAPPGREFTFRYPRPATSDRPLLRKKRDRTPELLTGLKDGEEKKKIAMKFASLGDLTDTDETDMDLSSADENSQRPRKRRVLDANIAAVVPPAPKWSNPDPYTVLPPPDESQAKKTDVVKLIRKARVAATAAQATTTRSDAVTSNQDFISLDFAADGSSLLENAPKGPKRARLDGRDLALGNRKRTYDDEIKGYSRNDKPTGEFYSDGGILDRWMPFSSENATPWLDTMEPTLHLGSRLVSIACD
jgi:non-canonical poly(A) RNA polymerase PAPD5/7